MKLSMVFAVALGVAWLGLWATSSGLLVYSSDTDVLSTRDCRYLVGATVQKRRSRSPNAVRYSAKSDANGRFGKSRDQTPDFLSARPQSVRRFNPLIRGPYFSTSVRITRRNSSAMAGKGSRPVANSWSPNVPSWVTLKSSRCRRSLASFGMSLGATTPNHERASNPG